MQWMRTSGSEPELVERRGSFVLQDVFANTLANTDPSSAAISKAQSLHKDVCDPRCVVMKNVGVDTQRDGRVSVAEPIGNHMNRHPPRGGAGSCGCRSARPR